MRRTLISLLAVLAFASTLETAAHATGQRLHKPIITARVGGYEPPDPCLGAQSASARCTGSHHLGNVGGPGKTQ
jgi:hypothetical protein